MSEPEKPILPYALPRRTRREIRKVDLVVVVLFVTALVVFIKWKSIHEFYVAAQAHRWERRCMKHQPAADTVVYSDDSSVIASVLQDGRYHRLRADAAIMYQPPELAGMWRWRDYAASGKPRKQSGAVLYLHQRTAANGAQRLVCVVVAPTRSQGVDLPRNLIFCTSTETTGSFTTRSNTPTTFSNHFAFSPTSGDHTTIFAGQTDPSDPARFTIRYTFNDKPGTIDGRLLDTGRVQLKPREGKIWFPDTSFRRWIPGTE